MREIKFRAWDKTNRYYERIMQMHFPVLPKDDDGSVVVMTSLLEMLYSDNAIIEQYTGFEDESDKPIYEGDIVHVWDNGNGVVMFKNGSFMVDLGSDDSSSLSSEAWPLLTWNPEDYEVIGNIHENPELLEDKNEKY